MQRLKRTEVTETESAVLRGEGKPPVRVAVLLPALDVPAWQHALLLRIARSEHAELALALLTEPREGMSRSAGAVSRAYAALDRRLRCEADALAPASAAAILEGVPILRTREAADQDGPTPEQRAAVASCQLDVIVDLSSRATHREWLALTHCGLWRFFFGDADAGFGEPPGFWEVHLGCSIVVSGIEIACAEGSEVRVVRYPAISGVKPISVRLTNNAVYWKLPSLLTHKLEQLRRLGKSRLLDRPVGETRPSRSRSHSPARSAFGEPGAARMSLHIARTLARRCVDFAVRAAMRRPWILLFRLTRSRSIHAAGFTQLVAPRDRYWADPFVIARDGCYYVFIEEVPNSTGKGHISVLVMDRDGRWHGPHRVLAHPYHLSYPFVFESEGALYMMPESSEHRSVQLYRCVEFPLRWEFVENLLQDTYAVDPTLLRYAGKWWLFANVVEHTGASSWEDLFLFFSDTLTGGRWTPHPLNPIVSDVRRSRPAGAIYVEDGRLCRPAQDCSVRYGYAIRINHITRLTEDDYAEVEVAAITPDWDHRIVATHTINHVEGLTILDAMQPRLRI